MFKILSSSLVTCTVCLCRSSWNSKYISVCWLLIHLFNGLKWINKQRQKKNSSHILIDEKSKPERTQETTDKKLISWNVDCITGNNSFIFITRTWISSPWCPHFLNTTVTIRSTLMMLVGHWHLGSKGCCIIILQILMNFEKS